MDAITFPENLLTTSGLSILMHGVISLPDPMSYDKCICYGYTKEPSQLDGSIEHPKQNLMLKLMDKKLFTILCIFDPLIVSPFTCKMGFS